MTVAYVAMIGVNLAANLLPINGQTTAEISNKQDVLFTPAGYVFSIWGIIYILLAIWLILQVKNRHTVLAPTNRVRLLFIFSCALNIGWLFTWHYEYFAFSVLIMLLLFVTLIRIYLHYPTTDSRFGGRFPFSFYLGWISVATLANISYTLNYYDISFGVSEPVGTILLLVIATAVAIGGRYFANDPYFAIVFVWAIVGIAARNTEPRIVIVSYTLAALLFLVILAVSFFQKRKEQPIEQNPPE